MIEEVKTLTIIDYLEIAWRRKWLIIIPFLLIMPVAIALCLVLPKIYKAGTTVLVIPQKVPDSFIKSTVTMNPSEYLNVISQEIMSRTRLEKIINELSLFPEQNKKVPIENLISIMRKNIDLEIHSANRNRGVSSFTISYQGENPQAVMLTANRISSLFIEENLKSREQQAKKTTDFLSSELGSLKVILEEQEKIISKFKQSYLGSLPEQRDANLRMLDQLILQRQRITDELNDTENRKFLLQQQLLQSDSLLPAANDEQSVFPAGSLQARISETKRRITKLQNKYTEEHPDVISAKAELQKLLAQSNNRYESNNIHEETGSPFGSEINRQLLALNLEIKTLKNEDSIIKKKISSYQSRVEMAPKLEQEMASLTRDYKNTKSAYDELMQKRLEAAQSEKLEINQQGEQFKVLDPAKLPLRPFKPDRLKILLIGFMLSLGLGGGLVFLMEYLDQSFYSVKDIESYLELPVLASIPLVSTKNHEKSLPKLLSIFL